MMKKNKNKNFILYIMKIRRYISKNKSKKKISRNLKTRNLKQRNLKQRNLKTRKFKPHYKKKTLKQIKGGAFTDNEIKDYINNIISDVDFKKKVIDAYEEEKIVMNSLPEDLLSFIEKIRKENKPDNKNIYNKLEAKANTNPANRPPHYNRLYRIYNVKEGNEGNNPYESIDYKLFEPKPTSKPNTPPNLPRSRPLSPKRLNTDSVKMKSSYRYVRPEHNSANMRIPSPVLHSSSHSKSPIYADDDRIIIEERKRKEEEERERESEEVRGLWQNEIYNKKNWLQKLYARKNNNEKYEKDKKERKRKEKEKDQEIRKAINSN